MNQMQQEMQQEIQLEPQVQYPNPFAYFANTPISIDRRKRQATRQSNMKIVDFTHNIVDNNFNVIIKGNRGIIYDIFFSESAITCSCPDFQNHTVKPICKHMFKCICLSENHDIFNNSMLLTELMNPFYIERILTNILRIIDIKKMERYGGHQNQISIERDEYCPICYGDFDANIVRCSICAHVFHTQCIRLSWNSSAYNVKCVCPICRSLNSFPQLSGSNYDNDPWEIYNFSQPDTVIVQQDDNIEENHDGPIENLDDIIIPVQVLELENGQILYEDDNGGGPNENPDDAYISGNAIITCSLSEHDDNNIIKRIKILNISVFILDTINIIFNTIYQQQSQQD